MVEIDKWRTFVQVRVMTHETRLPADYMVTSNHYSFVFILMIVVELIDTYFQ